MSEARDDRPPIDDYDEEPSALGAAATLPAARRRERKAEARRARRQAALSRPELRGLTAVEGGSGVVNVYEPTSGPTTSLGQYARDIWGRRHFLAALARSDLRGARSSTVLGGIWGLLDPIFQSAIYYFLFVVVRGGQGRPVEFLPLLIGGIFLFRLTTSAMTEGGNSIQRSTSLMLSSSFPRAILPLATVYKGLLEFLPSIVVFAGVYVLLGEPPQGNLFWVPVQFGIQMVMSVGLALATATLLVFFKDAQKAMRYVTRILFFTTPIIYPLTLLPEDIRSVLVYQPLFPLFANYQRLFRGDGLDTTLFAYSVLWAIGFVLVGTWLFRRTEREMASRL
jgi:ABC-type polysaccharide/polyol phosphate export permease